MNEQQPNQANELAKRIVALLNDDERAEYDSLSDRLADAQFSLQQAQINVAQAELEVRRALARFANAHREEIEG